MWHDPIETYKFYLLFHPQTFLFLEQSGVSTEKQHNKMERWAAEAKPSATFSSHTSMVHYYTHSLDLIWEKQICVEWYVCIWRRSKKRSFYLTEQQSICLFVFFSGNVIGKMNWTSFSDSYWILNDNPHCNNLLNGFRKLNFDDRCYDTALLSRLNMPTCT